MPARATVVSVAGNGRSACEMMTASKCTIRSFHNTEAMFLNLTGKNQMEISQMLGISQPAVNRRLKAAHSDTIHKFINRFEHLLNANKS